MGYRGGVYPNLEAEHSAEAGPHPSQRGEQLALRDPDSRALARSSLAS